MDYSTSYKHQQQTQDLHTRNYKTGDWNDVSVVKITDCSPRSPRFDSQHLPGGSQPSVIPVQRHPTYIQARHSYASKKKKKSKKEKKNVLASRATMVQEIEMGSGLERWHSQYNHWWSQRIQVCFPEPAEQLLTACYFSSKGLKLPSGLLRHHTNVHRHTRKQNTHTQ